MTVAVPVLSVAGLTIATADPAAELVAVDRLSLPWGRGSVLEAPTPATLSLRLRDTSRGATFARRIDLIGRPVVVSWRADDGSTGVMFRGRITDADAIPRRRGGFYVALECSSKEIDAANYTAPEGTVWPAETFGARLARINGLMPAGLFSGGVHMPGLDDAGITDPADPSLDLVDYPVAAAEPGGQTALDLLREFYASLSALPMIYDPELDGLRFVRRRAFTYNNAATGAVVGRLLPWGPDGRYMAAPVDKSWAVPMPASAFEYAGSLGQPMDTRMTRVELSYPTADGRGLAVAPVDVGLEADIGRRTLTVSTIHGSAGNAALFAGLWAGVAGAEGRLPRLAPLRYRTSARRPFPAASTPPLLLAGVEQENYLFLNGSWLPALGQRPLVGIIGGTIVYADGQWDVELQPAPVAVTAATVPPLRIRYAAASTAARLRDLDPALTVGDLAFVEVGAGYTSATQPPWGT